MNTYYPLDVWESVLKEVGFSFIEEYVGPADFNRLLYRKEVDFKPIEIRIWFNKKTELITNINIEVLHNKNDLGSYIEIFPLDFFIHFYFDRFRDNLIGKIID